ncbi:CPBP family intramembrane glutamic endopeptidase [Pseudomonas aeruginosa]
MAGTERRGGLAGRGGFLPRPAAKPVDPLVRRLAGIIVATLAYAALHLLVNPVYALLAGIAGLGYGMVLHFSGRLSLAVLLHALDQHPALPPAELPVPPDLRVIRRP